jgi:Tfp pilus assembly protein PilE
MRRAPGLTLIEILTVLVALTVVVAVAIPLWRTHELRTQRQSAMKVLRAIQTAQDRHFADQARYSDLEHLKVDLGKTRYTFEVKTSGDELAYVATALATRREHAFDARCARLSIDQHGRHFAADDAGEDSTADCWDRK